MPVDRSDLITWLVHGEPVPYVRQSQRDKWEHRPAVSRYRTWCDLIRLQSMDKFRCGALTGPVGLGVFFAMPIPSSWTKTEQRRAENLQRWPTGANSGDLDNLVKGVADALQGMAWENDSQVIGLGVSWKGYSKEPGAWIMVNTEPVRWFDENLAPYIGGWPPVFPEAVATRLRH